MVENNKFYRIKYHKGENLVRFGRLLPFKTFYRNSTPKFPFPPLQLWHSIKSERDKIAKLCYLYI